MKLALKYLSQRAGVFYHLRESARMFSPAARRSRKRDGRLYAQFISHGDLVFDIGANLGQKAEIFLDLGARVVCLEPNPHCCAYLGRKFRDSPVTVAEIAVGAEAGHADLHFVSTASTGSLRADWKHYEGGRAVEHRSVPVTTLDQLVATHGSPAFVKIDVEGFEVPVLAGLSTPTRCLSFEYHRQELDRTTKCLDRLVGIGFERFNFINMDGGEMLCKHWMRADELLDLLRSKIASNTGDVFATAPVA